GHRGIGRELAAQRIIPIPIHQIAAVRKQAFYLAALPLWVFFHKAQELTVGYGKYVHLKGCYGNRGGVYPIQGNISPSLDGNHFDRNGIYLVQWNIGPSFNGSHFHRLGMGMQHGDAAYKEEGYFKKGTHNQY